MNYKIRKRLDDLYARPSSEEFNKEELSFIKNHLNTSRWSIIYCLFTQNSVQNKYVGFFVDYMSNNPRGRKPIHYSMDVIARRELNKKELEWEFENYGTRNRRFHGWWISSILWVQQMDAVYGIETPKEFVDICNKKGYNTGVQQTFNI